MPLCVITVTTHDLMHAHTLYIVDQIPAKVGHSRMFVQAHLFMVKNVLMYYHYIQFYLLRVSVFECACLCVGL